MQLAEPVFLPDISKAELTPDEAAVCEARGLRSILYVPTMLPGEAVGVFIVGTTTDLWMFEETDLTLCRALSQEIALAITNARLFESAQLARAELLLAYDATLLGWSLALEMRDGETHGHAERVTRLTLDLVEMLGMAEDEMLHVRRGALLHDIGKMVIPDSILLKPGPLDAAEWDVMRKHPETARDFMSRIDYLVPAIDIPLYHHEKWDGSGYPRGLSGEDIPISARAFAVVDVYDALTSDRPYRLAWTEDEAVEYIRAQAGAHFDPSAAAMFLDLLKGAGKQTA